MAEIIYVTAEWLIKLQEELKQLQEVKRIEIAEKLKEANLIFSISESTIRLRCTQAADMTAVLQCFRICLRCLLFWGRG